MGGCVALSQTEEDGEVWILVETRAGIPGSRDTEHRQGTRREVLRRRLGSATRRWAWNPVIRRGNKIDTAFVESRAAIDTLDAADDSERGRTFTAPATLESRYTRHIAP